MRILNRLILTLCCVAGFAHAERGDQVFTFGITPQHAPGAQGKLWVPICQYLSKRTGYQIQFKTSKDLRTFWKDADAGVFDFLYINPYYYTKAQKMAGYSAVAKDGGTPLVGIIVVRSDGPQHVKALQGAKIATHDASAFMTNYVRYGYLLEQGVQIDPISVGSLDSVYLTVDKGLYPAGISIQRAFGLLEPAMQTQFKVIWKSDELPPFAYAVHPRVASEAVERFRRALLEMDDDAEGRALLAKVNIKEIGAAKDSDYDAMRKLKIKME